MNMSKLASTIVLLAVAAACADACSPAQKGNIARLKKFFGIEPFYPNGEMETNGYSDDYILEPADLNCNFNTDESPLPDEGSNKAALCKWKNMKGERTDIDTEQYYLFTKTQESNPWNALKPKRDRDEQTPAVGDGFALTGGEGKPAPQSVYYSAPIKCSEQETTLSFDYWLFSAAEIEVLVLEEGTYNTLHTSAKGVCNRARPKDGRCVVNIPAQTKPYHLAIHATDLHKQFAIIDDIAYEGDLGAACEGGGDPFDFGTVPSSLANRGNAGFITSSSDLDCQGEAGCYWSNSPNSDVLFERHNAPVDADKWLAATGDATTPSGDFYMARGNSGKAELISDPIECQSNDGILSFRAWASKDTRIEVCVVDADSLQSIYPCEVIYPPMQNGEPFYLPIFGPLKNARILFRGSDWNAGNGGMVAIDDIEYDAEMCPDQPLTTIAPVDPDDEVCKEISTNFDQSTVSTSSWQPYPGSNYQGHPLVKHRIDPAVKTAQNTQVDCPDGTLCAGSALDKTQSLPITVLQTNEFQPLQRARFLQINTRRGTYGTGIHMCINQMPDITGTGNVTASGNCQIISGPELTYTEYRNGKVSGAVLPEGTKQVFIVFTNPEDSGADKAGFLVDDIQLLRDENLNSGPLCEQGSKAK